MAGEGPERNFIQIGWADQNEKSCLTSNDNPYLKLPKRNALYHLISQTHVKTKYHHPPTQTIKGLDQLYEPARMSTPNKTAGQPTLV